MILQWSFLPNSRIDSLADDDFQWLEVRKQEIHLAILPSADTATDLQIACMS